jgi:Fe-S-cluster containining protein
MDSKPWYQNGLRFECTACGNCCRNHGEYSFVNLTEPEVRAIAGYLKLGREEFLERYCDKKPGFHPALKMDAPACPFLGDDNRCGIYPVRPKQCATWPFWSENLAREIWEGPVKQCCPGLDTGKLYPADEVERIARDNDDWYSQ